MYNPGEATPRRCNAAKVNKADYNNQSKSINDYYCKTRVKRKEDQTEKEKWRD
jgi:hypothetical protein